jgi:hypothetical protein
MYNMTRTAQYTDPGEFVVVWSSAVVQMKYVIHIRCSVVLSSISTVHESCTQVAQSSANQPLTCTSN